MRTRTAEELAQGQLEAYNNQDIDSFCQYFAEDVRVYDAHNRELLFSGMVDFRKRYLKSFRNPELHCTLVNRMVQENIVIDQESVVGLREGIVEAIAIYHTKDGFITDVYFY